MKQNLVQAIAAFDAICRHLTGAFANGGGTNTEIAFKCAKQAMEDLSAFVSRMEKPAEVHVIFGSEAVAALTNSGKISDEVVRALNTYAFDNQLIADAFLQGVEQGCGWLDYYVPNAAEVKKIQRKLKREDQEAAARAPVAASVVSSASTAAGA